MRAPWWLRLPGGPPAIDLDPDTFAGRVAAGQRKTIHVRPPAEPNPEKEPGLNDAERADMWKRIAEGRLARMADLEAENTRLRASLALAQQTGGRPADCGHQATLARYDALLAQCRAEHLDGDEAERLRTAAWPKLEVPW